MRKIIVIGCPGAGKSTFSRKLSDASGIPLYYLDMLWHKPDKTNITTEEFDEKLSGILKKESWIIDGNYQRTLEFRLKECDTVFFFDIPPELCLSGAFSRIGTKRDDMPWLETELDEQFKRDIIDFPKTKVPQIYELLEKYREGREIVVFKSREDANGYLAICSNFPPFKK